MSQSGNLQEAVRGLDKPQLIMLMSNSGQFEAHVKKLEELFPKVPSIGCIGMSYDTKVAEKGVSVIAYYGIAGAAANVLENVSLMPVKYIDRLEKDVHDVNGSGRDTHHYLQRIEAPQHSIGRRYRRRRENICQRQSISRCRGICPR